MADVVTPHHRVGPRKKKRNHSDSESDEGGDGGFPGGASGSDRKRSKFEHDRVDKPVDAGSTVEEIALGDTTFVPSERIPTIVVDSFPALGRLTAMRFLEWAQRNPGGVISLPTGKTPEHFIRWVQRCLQTWDEPETQAVLTESGVDASTKPDMKSLYFVQIDEWYPIRVTHRASFIKYVREFYIEGFGLDPEKCLLIDATNVGLKPGEELEDIWGPEGAVDISLRFREPNTAMEAKQKSVIEALDQYCFEYERQIRSLGGIQFFLGGLGPDGHIGFDVRGSDHYSTTRLTPVNYETQAAAATSLGGIELARRRMVITIGLNTIAFRKDVVAIIIAAGEAKARVVHKALERRQHLRYPASVLHGAPNARFYLTTGAAKHLRARRLRTIQALEAPDDRLVDEVMINLSRRTETRILDLTADQVAADGEATAVLSKRGLALEDEKQAVVERIKAKIVKGSTAKTNTRMLHTEPHHDDIMLGYLAQVVRNTRVASNTHFMTCLTSGFNSVTNAFMLGEMTLALETLSLEKDNFRKLFGEGYFVAEDSSAATRDVLAFLDGIAQRDELMQRNGITRRLIRNAIVIFGVDNTLEAVVEKFTALKAYFTNQPPGEPDSKDIQTFKGSVREFEADSLWGYIGWDGDSIRHLRLPMYTSDIFEPEPTHESDVRPMLDLIREVDPDIVGVALDPEASGPSTHYRVLQVVTEALKAHETEKDITVWGYRNVWFDFHAAEADVMTPVSLNMFALLQDMFMKTFRSQKEASFPSHEHDGPFSELAQAIQCAQYEDMKTALGSDWFFNHPSPLIRCTRGLVYLKEMSLDEFKQHSLDLASKTEALP